MNAGRFNIWRWVSAAAACGLCAAVGCSEEGVTDEPPPEGKGSLVVDNSTSDTINVFVGGVQTAIVEAVESSSVYLAPGLYRVVLDQDDGIRNFRGDVDILLGKQTILYVDYDLTNANLYRVVMEID